MIGQSFRFFGGAPGFSKHSVHVGSNHGAGVVEREQGIENDLLKFTLPRNSSPTPFDGGVLPARSSCPHWVAWVLI